MLAYKYACLSDSCQHPTFFRKHCTAELKPLLSDPVSHQKLVVSMPQEAAFVLRQQAQVQNVMQDV